MPQTFARLTLYALLSAIEEDLRDLIALHLTGQGEPRDLFGAEIAERASAKYLRDVGMSPSNASLDQLLNYTDFGDLCQILNRQRSLLPTALAAYIREVTPLLDNQIEFVNEIVDHLTEHGVLSVDRLYESPYTDFSPLGVEGIFESSDLKRLVGILDDIRQHAVAS
jgi:hypothetical protein